MKAELQEIIDDLEFDSDEERAGFEKYLVNDKIGSKIAAAYMKNKDYTSKTQALADARRQFEKEQTDWNQGKDYMDRQNAAWKEDVEKRLNSSLDQVSQSRLYGAALESKLQTVAAEYGLDFEDLMKDVKDRRAADPPAKSAEPDYEPYDKRYVGRDDFRKAADTMFGFAPQIRDFEREYKKLFGQEFDGEITDLVAESSREVQARQQRGQQSDLWSVMREKLDFSGQKARNDEAAKTKAAADQESWKKQTREEIERDVQTKYAVQYPNARPQDKSDEWRNNLSAKKREAPQRERTSSPMDDFKRRQEIHQAYEERAAKHEAA